MLYTGIVSALMKKSIADQDAMDDFISITEDLINNGVTIKVLMGGMTEKPLENETFIQIARFLPLLDSIEMKFIDLSTNAFDIIDREKVILKINNPIDPNEYFTVIYAWQKEFTHRLRFLISLQILKFFRQVSQKIGG